MRWNGQLGYSGLKVNVSWGKMGVNQDVLGQLSRVNWDGILGDWWGYIDNGVGILRKWAMRGGTRNNLFPLL